MTDQCPACNVPFTDHGGIAVTCAEVRRLKRKLPNAVMQTTPTNCFRACVATILKLPIEDVPISCDGASWCWEAFQGWLGRRNLQAIEITFDNGGTIYPVRKPVDCILTGRSPRDPENKRHAVVGRFVGLEGFELLHDPHEAQEWIDGEPTHAVFFVPIGESEEVQRLRSRLAAVREKLQQIVNVIDSTDTYFVDMTDSEMAESVIAELWEIVK